MTIIDYLLVYHLMKFLVLGVRNCSKFGCTQSLCVFTTSKSIKVDVHWASMKPRASQASKHSSLASALANSANGARVISCSKLNVELQSGSAPGILFSLLQHGSFCFVRFFRGLLVGLIGFTGES